MDMKITFPGGKRVDAELFGHVIHTDQSRQAGGDGSAPEPFLTFLASLGTCAGIYVLGFCQARGLSTEGISLVQKHAFNPVSHKLEKVSIEVHVPPSFPEKYRAAVQRAADMCAVKKVITDPPQFEVKTVVEQQSSQVSTEA